MLIFARISLAVAEREALQEKAEAEAKASEAAAASAGDAAPAQAAPLADQPQGAAPATAAAAAAFPAPEGGQGAVAGAPKAQDSQADAAKQSIPAKPPEVPRLKVLYIQERSEHDKQVLHCATVSAHSNLHAEVYIVKPQPCILPKQA